MNNNFLFLFSIFQLLMKSRLEIQLQFFRRWQKLQNKDRIALTAFSLHIYAFLRRIRLLNVKFNRNQRRPLLSFSFWKFPVLKIDVSSHQKLRQITARKITTNGNKMENSVLTSDRRSTYRDDDVLRT